MVNTPPGWRTRSLGENSASFRNEQYELSVTVEPRYRASASRKRGQAQSPRSYRVQVVQDWFSKGVHGDRAMAAKAETWTEAVETAQAFMAEFSTERAGQSDREVEATHRSVGDAATAETLLTTEAAAEAFADSAGYDDRLLFDVLEAATGGQYRVVAHRDGDVIDVVYGDDDPFLETCSLESLYASFPVDKLGVDAVLTGTEELVLTVSFGEFSIYRFIVSGREETDVVLERGTQVTSPAFENTIWNVLEERE